MQSKVFAVFVAVVSVVIGAGPAASATLSRDSLSRKLLDVCVYRQFAVKNVNRQKMVDGCRCSVKTAMEMLPGDAFDEPRSGGLTAPQDRAIRTGIAACFKAG